MLPACAPCAPPGVNQVNPAERQDNDSVNLIAITLFGPTVFSASIPSRLKVTVGPNGV
jgi:hypothetical protein